MKKLNVVLVYNKKIDKILMCERKKDPYRGMYNLVGGKVEENEDDLESAYRELKEETGITKKDINLKLVMKFQYAITGIELQLYAGKLNKEVELVEEVNRLFWSNINENYFDLEKYAGEGNIGHMLEQVKIHKDEIFN